MDDNQPTENVTNIEVNKEAYHSCCDRHPVIKCLLLALVMFLGAFCAFYVVTDWYMKTHFPFNPMFRPHNIDRMINQEMKEFNNLVKPERIIPQTHNNIIHMEQTPDCYKIIVNLRAFDNNENNVKISSKGNLLTITGKTVREGKNREQISEFQQSYLFEDNVDLKRMEKTCDGNFCIIKIPIGSDD